VFTQEFPISFLGVFAAYQQGLLADLAGLSQI
jgi:hypothetical protein